jgi:hypothetical protein
VLKGATMATAHLKECVQLLLKHMHTVTDRITPDMYLESHTEAFVAAFELIDQPWEFTGAKDVLIWREGYEQCMKDIVDAIADEWGVALPADPLRTKENDRGGEGQ